MKTKTCEAVETFINGNRSDFKTWLTRATKLDMLDAIEYYAAAHGGRHLIISTMRNYLGE